MTYLGRFLLILSFLPLGASAQEGDSEPLPLWDYGVALAYLRFPFYPASEQIKVWYLPVPTFEYRGEILRSTQKEGTRAYFLKSENWSLEVGGSGVVEVKSDETFARQGMPDIPWSLQLGPKAVYRDGDGTELDFGLYQSIVTDFSRSKTNGSIYQAEISHSWLYPVKKSNAKTTFSLATWGASQEYFATYFDVKAEDATAQRPRYESRSGFLSYEFSMVQSFKYRKYSYFAYFNAERFELSANRTSPLHRTDQNLSITVGVTYVLGESKRKAMPEDEGQGLLQKIKIPGLEQK